jgi:trimethylamine--corrinoid protein Co-methyltransferase
MSFAESLSSLVISQLVNEGTPVIIGGTISLMDMKTTQITYASPEFSLMAAGLANMAQYYKIPAMTTAGCTDSKCVDQQAGIDIATNCLMAALSGGNLIHDVGYMESGVSSSLQLLVIADEVISQVKRLVRGIEVNKETLALDVIENVGPGGHFMAEKHTFDNFKKEWWFPEIFNRDRYDTWTEKEKPDLGCIANKKLCEIIKNHKAESLNNETKEKIRNILLSL